MSSGGPQHVVPLRRLALVTAVLFVVALLVWRWWPQDALVIYCAHDAVHAAAVIASFEKETGIPVRVKYDTEATKSLGLVELLMQERARPRCDVFWNNELLGTLRLAEAGVLEPVKMANQARIPDRFKDPGGRWVGFGARFRVMIVNTEKLAADREVIDDYLGQDDLSRVAIAKPLYGTTRTHYTVLWRTLGAEEVQAWHRSMVDRGIQIVNGNAITKQLVAEGICDVGFTDTDDYFVAVRSGKPVGMVPARTPDDEVICIPNTIAVIKGTRRRAWARQFADYLVSQATEIALASGTARQVPLGSVPPETLPEEVRALLPLVTEATDLTQLGDAPDACLEWLREM